MNIIDSLVVTLKLDDSQFNKGKAAAISAFDKTKQAAVKATKDVDESTKKLADSFTKLRNEALGFFAILLGARGIKEFVAGITGANAELGRFADNMGESSQTIAAWGMAVERVGGSSKDAEASFKTIAKALYDLHQNGKALPDEFYRLQAATNFKIDTEHGAAKFLSDTAAALKALYDVDPTRAYFIAQGMGIDESTANLMFKYGAGIGKVVEETKKLAQSNGAIKAAQDLSAAWVTLQQNAISLGNAIVSNLSPVIVPLLEQMSKWLQANRELILSKVNEYVEQFSKWLATIDWVSVGNGAAELAKDLVAVAQALADIVKFVSDNAFVNFLNKFSAGADKVGADIGKEWGTDKIGPAIKGWFGGGSSGSQEDRGTRAHPMVVEPANPSTSSGGLWEWLFGKSDGSGGGGIFGGLTGLFSGGAKAAKGDLGANQNEVYKTARSEGLSDNAARALAANFSGESLANPADRSGDNGQAQGIAQWHPGRAAAIKAQFGKDPADMTVAEQTRAAIWEMKTNPDYAQSWAALNSGMRPEQMLGALVSNYERPANTMAALQERQRYLAGLPASMGGNGGSMWAGSDLPNGIPQGGASLSTMGMAHPVTTSSSSNSINISRLDVNAPQATDANGIAGAISDALARSTFSMMAQSGQA